MRIPLPRLALLGWLVLALTACASTSDQASRAFKADGDPVKAWRVVALKLQQDGFSSPEDKCRSCLVGFERLFRGPDPGGDLFRRSGRSGSKAVRHPRAMPEHTYSIPARSAYARYFKGTERPGLAVPHALQCIEKAEGKDAIKVMNAYALAADLFHEMGRYGLRDRYMEQALRRQDGTSRA